MQAYREWHVCDECGQVLTGNPPSYLHRCAGGHARGLDDTYPRIIHILAPESKP